MALPATQRISRRLMRIACPQKSTDSIGSYQTGEAVVFVTQNGEAA